jgi:hypothetical protein
MYSLSQFNERRISKLLQEAQVVLVEVVDAVYGVPKHCDSVYSHPKGIAGVPFRVVPGVAKDLRMNHAAAQDFEPAAVLAYATALALAY